MEKNKEITYSCKRKKDLVTSLAIIFFAGVICFELYLIVFLPIQLSRKNAMLLQVEKQRLVALADDMRYRINRSIKPDKDLICEHAMVTVVLDITAMYLREHQNVLSLHQASTVKQMLLKYNSIMDTWQVMNQRRFRYEKMDVKPLLDALRMKYNVKPLKTVEKAGKK